MRDALRQRCVLFIENRDIVKSALGWENAYLYPLCASLYAARGWRADPNALRYCHNLLKAHTGLFSNFRGTAMLATVTSLSMSENPEDKLARMMGVYEQLKTVFFASEYLTVAAGAITDLADPSEYGLITRHTRAIYDRMKAAHPFLTSGEDSAFAALLALSGLDDAHIEEEMERCYAILKPSFFSGNAVQSLSHVLSLGEAPAEEKCRKATALFETLKARGYKYGTGYELSTLGALALLEADAQTLAQDMVDADDFLKAQKGFGALGVGARQRLMYAGMLTMCDYIPAVPSMQYAALNGIVSLVIAQQAAICAAVAASAAASAAASSSS